MTDQCPRCDGTGEITIESRGYFRMKGNTAANDDLETKIECPECEGSGDAPEEE